MGLCKFERCVEWQKSVLEKNIERWSNVVWLQTVGKALPKLWRNRSRMLVSGLIRMYATTWATAPILVWTALTGCLLLRDPMDFMLLVSTQEISPFIPHSWSCDISLLLAIWNGNHLMITVIFPSSIKYWYKYVATSLYSCIRNCQYIQKTSLSSYSDYISQENGRYAYLMSLEAAAWSRDRLRAAPDFSETKLPNPQVLKFSALGESDANLVTL